jgi:hypothetical protein
MPSLTRAGDHRELDATTDQPNLINNIQYKTDLTPMEANEKFRKRLKEFTQ